MKPIHTILSVFLILSLTSVRAQTTSADQLIKEKYTLAGDNVKLGKYNEAIPHLSWLIKNAPDFSESVQSWAIQAFEQAANNTESKARKSILLDSMVVAYKSRQEHFGLSDLEKNKFAFRYFKYFRGDKVKMAEAYPLFQDIFNKPESLLNNNLVPFMYITAEYNELVKPLDQNEVMENYLLVSALITERYYNDDKKRFDDYTSHIDNNLLKILGNPLPCAAVNELSAGLSQPDSLNVAKKIMTFSLSGSCDKTEDYMNSLKIISRNEPTPGILKILSQYSAAEKDFETALSFNIQAFNLETDLKKKADLSMDIAMLHYANMDKPSAREYAFKAIELDEDQSAMAYSFIGNLYMASFDECAGRYDIVQDKAVYLAAYDMFKKANDTKGMEAAAQQFPTREEAFNLDLLDGEPLEVGCWIKTKTILKTRVSN